MTGYKLTFARSARKELQALPLNLSERVLEKIVALMFNPRPAGCKRLIGSKDLWRVRVGEYRVVYKYR